MKILFLCASLEPGKDGVGDYTMVLATELQKLGNEIKIIAIKDSYVLKDKTEEKICTENVTLNCVRFKKNNLSKKTLKNIKSEIDQFSPHLISLQFVIYGYHAKGIPWFLPTQLKVLTNAYPLHIMFHELWIGFLNKKSFKIQLIGLLQKKCIQSLIRNLKPQWISTSNDFYKKMLLSIDVESSLLPVFSNMPIGDDSYSLLYNNIEYNIRKNRQDYIFGVFFGAIHPIDNFNLQIRKLKSIVNKSNKQLFVIHIGKCSNVDQLLIPILKAEGISFKSFGIQDSKDIADLFKCCDIGISTYPKYLIQKSGSIAAMLNNSLPMVVLNSFDTFKSQNYEYIQTVDHLDDIATVLNLKKDFTSLYGVNNIANRFIELINNNKLLLY